MHDNIPVKGNIHRDKTDIQNENTSNMDLLNELDEADVRSRKDVRFVKANTKKLSHAKSVEVMLMILTKIIAMNAKAK